MAAPGNVKPSVKRIAYHLAPCPEPLSALDTAQSGGHKSLFPIGIPNYQNDFWSRELEQW
jgi:hypothetical protein